MNIYNFLIFPDGLHFRLWENHGRLPHTTPLPDTYFSRGSVYLNEIHVNVARTDVARTDVTRTDEVHSDVARTEEASLKALHRYHRTKRHIREEEITSIQHQLHSLVDQMGLVNNKLNDLKKSNKNEYRSQQPQTFSSGQTQFIQPQKNDDPTALNSARGLAAESIHTSQQVFYQQPQFHVQHQQYPLCYMANGHGGLAPVYQYPTVYVTAPGQQQPSYFTSSTPQHRSNPAPISNTPITCMYLAPPPVNHFGARADVEVAKPYIVVPTVLRPEMVSAPVSGPINTNGNFYGNTPVKNYNKRVNTTDYAHTNRAESTLENSAVNGKNVPNSHINLNKDHHVKSYSEHSDNTFTVTTTAIPKIKHTTSDYLDYDFSSDVVTEMKRIQPAKLKKAAAKMKPVTSAVKTELVRETGQTESVTKAVKMENEAAKMELEKGETKTKPATERAKMMPMTEEIKTESVTSANKTKPVTEAAKLNPVTSMLMNETARSAETQRAHGKNFLY
jgi:hypothetical protein